MVELKRIKELEKALATERTLRMEELYRREKQAQELLDVQQELSHLMLSLECQADTIRKVRAETIRKSTSIFNFNLRLNWRTKDSKRQMQS